MGEVELSIWDNRSPVLRALVHTVLFFFAPAAVAATFSENMVVRLIQTMGLAGSILLGFLIRHDAAVNWKYPFNSNKTNRGDTE